MTLNHNTSEEFLGCMCVCVSVCVCISCSVVSDSSWSHGTIAHQASLSMGFRGKNTGVGCHFLLQGIFPSEGLNPCLLQCRWILYCLSHQVSPFLGYMKVLKIALLWLYFTCSSSRWNQPPSITHYYMMKPRNFPGGSFLMLYLLAIFMLKMSTMSILKWHIQSYLYPSD